MLLNRKEFLQIGSLATGSLLVPKFLKAFETPTLVPPGNKVVVVIQLSGGNDGLNTVIPVRNDIYYRSRPRLAISKEQALTLTDEAGLHPSLTAFKSLFDQGELSILNNVGYPNPDRSHFRSMDIWQTASSSTEYLNSGWIGRYLDHQCSGCDKPTQALEIDDTISLALKGNQYSGIALKDPRRLFGNANQQFYKDLLQQHHPAVQSESPVDYMYKTMASTLSSVEYIYQKSQVHPTSQTYPSTALAQSLKTIASLIFSDINTKVYYVSLGSFDTHIAQEGQQKRLFTELNDAVKAFTDDLKKEGRFNDVLLFTFSEFGRRVVQNASGGTDHGTANNMFLIGGGLQQKGLINALPDLGNLQDGDLKYMVDFKQVYATVLNKWLNADDQQILGTQYEYLSFI